MGGVELKAREASDNDGTLTRLGSTRSSSAERNNALLMATTVYCERNGSFCAARFGLLAVSSQAKIVRGVYLLWRW